VRKLGIAYGKEKLFFAGGENGSRILYSIKD
jgi:hypothetical protein